MLRPSIRLLYSPRMDSAVPTEFALIAGRGAYPRLIIEEARRHRVERVVLVAFRGETARGLARLADEVHWLSLGQIGRLLDVLKESGARHAIMAGQIRPTNVFRVRPDAWALNILRSLPVKNPHTVFGKVIEEISAIGIEVLPASTFMDRHMPGAGCLTRRSPDTREAADIELGLQIAVATTRLEIGQTVAVKEGIILAVEALEGTDRTIRRAGRLGGRGTVVVKMAKQGQDMRFDIPVIGPRTLRTLQRARASCLAFQAGCAIFLEREQVIARADRLGICIVGVETSPDAGSSA